MLIMIDSSFYIALFIFIPALSLFVNIVHLLFLCRRIPLQLWYFRENNKQRCIARIFFVITALSGFCYMLFGVRYIFIFPLLGCFVFLNVDAIIQRAKKGPAKRA